MASSAEVAPVIAQIPVIDVIGHSQLSQQPEGPLIGQGAVMADRVIPDRHPVVRVAGGRILHPVKALLLRDRIECPQKGRTPPAEGGVVLPVLKAELPIQSPEHPHRAAGELAAQEQDRQPRRQGAAIRRSRERTSFFRSWR